MCLFSKLIQNKKYVANKKNGGIIPRLPLSQDKNPNGEYYYDERVMFVAVGCGKCMECRRKKAREWQVRLLEDVRHDEYSITIQKKVDGIRKTVVERRRKEMAIFVTLTFSNEWVNHYQKGTKLQGYDLDNFIAKKAVREFLERWRKKHKTSVRHWLVTELGHEGTENIHLHGIIWTDKGGMEIEERWRNGKTWDSQREKGWVNEQTVNYITKYINKVDFDHQEYEAKVLCSAGIGKGYLERSDSYKNKYKKGKTKEVYTNRQGYEMAMPIYWRNKIYTEEEREWLWIEKLDQDVRYVNGERVSIHKDDKEYYRMLEEARILNKSLGYGDDVKNWDRVRYENERRNMNYAKRKGIKHYEKEIL